MRAAKLRINWGSCSSAGETAGDFKNNATDPIEHLAKIYPLIADEAKCMELYKRQKDLADRMSPRVTSHGQDDPQLKRADAGFAG